MQAWKVDSTAQALAYMRESIGLEIWAKFAENVRLSQFSFGFCGPAGKILDWFRRGDENLPEIAAASAVLRGTFI